MCGLAVGLTAASVRRRGPRCPPAHPNAPSVIAGRAADAGLRARRHAAHPEPRSRYGNPPFYEVFGKRYYVLSSSVGYVERGVASWYGPGFHKVRTSTGEPYDMYGMTAAHKTLPLPAYVRVTNLQNGRSIVVRVNDRGPFVGNRIIDLSYTAAAKARHVAQRHRPGRSARTRPIHAGAGSDGVYNHPCAGHDRSAHNCAGAGHHRSGGRGIGRGVARHRSAGGGAARQVRSVHPGGRILGPGERAEARG